MAEWYDKTEGMTRKEQQYMLNAYRNTFCKEVEGQMVLCHLRVALNEMTADISVSAEQRLAALNLLDMVLNNCGMTDNMKIIIALSDVAEQFNIPEQKQDSLI